MKQKIKYEPGQIIEFVTEGSSKKKVGVIIYFHENKYVIRRINSSNRYVVEPQNIFERKRMI